jgi:hypothetical protein
MDFRMGQPTGLILQYRPDEFIVRRSENVYKWNVRKGLEVLSGQPRQVGLFELTISLPAGSDIQDPESVRAALSLLFGTAWAESANIGTTLITNNL